MLNFKLYMDKAKKILKILKKNKAEAFVVGGAVRDFLLKKPITDVDITTNLLPEDVCEIFDIPKRRIRYGSVKIYFENNYFEITTYRKEAAYLDFRHPSCIIFIQHIKDDLQRRDFTINGLLLDEDDKIFDYVGGIKDLNNKIIRIIGNPYQKLTEDPLRMLRIFYFKAKLNFSVEENAETSSQDLQNYYNLVNDSDISETFYPTNSDNFPDFATLSGFESEKRIANSFILYVKKPEKFKNLGLIDPPSGILLYGTPGTGKTTFARAIAKETQLPFFEVSASIFSKKYRGQAVQMIRNLFRDVRKISKKYPGVILFIDECETIFCKLERLSGDAEIMNIVNQFKTELTSVENDPEHPIFILGATNNFMQIDDAIKSRFTYSIKVNPGNKKERRKFLEFLMEQKLKNPYSLEAKNFLYEVINEALERIDTTKNYDFLKTNRTLENLMKSAAMNFATKKASNDDDSKETVDIDDLKEAYSRIIVKLLINSSIILPF
ncbi:AAA family ATPase [Candidatus Phytoplasma australasiaticum]